MDFEKPVSLEEAHALGWLPYVLAASGCANLSVRVRCCCVHM